MTTICDQILEGLVELLIGPVNVKLCVASRPWPARVRGDNISASRTSEERIDDFQVLYTGYFDLREKGIRHLALYFSFTDHRQTNILHVFPVSEILGLGGQRRA